MYSTRPSIPCTCQVVGDLNHQGILLWRQKKVDAALESFTEATFAVRQHMMDQFDGMLRTRRSTVDSYKVGQPSLISIPLVPCSRDDEKGLSSSAPKAEHFVFYQRAFTLESYTSHEVGNGVYLAILLYNSGLAHHVMATQPRRKDSSRREIKQAFHCYRTALKVIRTAVPPATRENFYVMTLALLNNMGHLFTYCSQPEDAQSCRERLDSLLDVSFPGTMCDDDAAFFYFEKIYRDQGYFYAAAPAA